MKALKQLNIHFPHIQNTLDRDTEYLKTSSDHSWRHTIDTTLCGDVEGEEHGIVIRINYEDGTAPVLTLTLDSLGKVSTPKEMANIISTLLKRWAE